MVKKCCQKMLEILRKAASVFKRAETEEVEKIKLRRLLIGVIVALIIVLLILIFVWPKIFSASKDSPAKLKITIVTQEDCSQCWDTALFTDALATYNVKISTSSVNYDSAKGKRLVEKYKIEKIPTLIINGDLDGDPNLKPFWEALGEMQKDTFIFRQVIPPYVNVASGELKGKVQITYLTDNSCKECYDVRVHENALRNLAIPTMNYKMVDISSAEGKELISKYDIKVAPTILISGEVKEYESLGQLWAQVGKIAQDGTHVFTSVELMGKYKDLIKNKVITPPPASSATQ